MNNELIDKIDKWLHATREKLSVREIESLRKIGYKATFENKALKEELETFKGAFYLLEETSTEVENERDAEIEALKQSRDDLLKELDDVAGFILNNWNSRGQKVMKVIKKAQALKKSNE